MIPEIYLPEIQARVTQAQSIHDLTIQFGIGIALISFAASVTAWPGNTRGCSYTAICGVWMRIGGRMVRNRIEGQ